MPGPSHEQICEAALHILLRERGAGLLLSYQLIESLTEPGLATDEKLEVILHPYPPRPPNQGALVTLIKS